MGAAFGLLVFLGSFLLPAAKVSVTDLPGYRAAWNIVTFPFRETPDSICRVLVLVLIWPTNFLMLATSLLLLIGKPTRVNFLAGYGLAGQLYWLFDPDVRINEFGIGYWVWLISGIVLFVIAFLAGAQRLRPVSDELAEEAG